MEDPTLAEEDVVDNIVSNHLVERTPGDTATGKVAIIIDTKVTTIIASAAEFTVEGLIFRTTQSFTGVTDAGLILGPSDRLIQPRTDGNFSFIVDVEAAAIGEQFRLKKDTDMVMSAPPPGFVESFAAEDFSGGSSDESNQDLIDKLASGISTLVMAGRNNIEALHYQIICYIVVHFFLYLRKTHH